MLNWGLLKEKDDVLKEIKKFKKDIKNYEINHEEYHEDVKPMLYKFSYILNDLFVESEEIHKMIVKEIGLQANKYASLYNYIDFIVDMVKERGAMIPVDDAVSSILSDILEDETLINPYIFIVHGHDELSRYKLKEALNSLSIKYYVLQEQPTQGLKAIYEYIEDASNAVNYAICFLTPDDIYIDSDGNEHKRARENVYIEAGYLAGRLGRENVILLKHSDVAMPSDFSGIRYIPMDGNWTLEVARALKAKWPDHIDLNKLG